MTKRIDPFLYERCHPDRQESIGAKAVVYTEAEAIKGE